MPPVSKIAKLPDEVRAWLHRAIVERGYGDIVALTEDLNAMCKAGGLAISIGKSAVGAESQRIKRAQESIRATTEAARLIAESSPDDADHRSAAAMALVQSEMFDLLLQVREAEGMDDPMERMGVMDKAALALSRLSRARVNQARWAVDVEARAKVAADQVSKLARQGGLSEATVAEIRASILGIAPQAAAPAAG
jgi:hypothetical protein